MSKKFQTAVFYFPNWHVDEANERYHGKNWTEWELLKIATPRFEGHMQPKVPLWGYEDEADPRVMKKRLIPHLILVWIVFFLIGIGLKTDHFFQDVLRKAF